MKNYLIILVAALPFYGLVSIALPALNSIGMSLFIIDSLTITAYWPITLIFHLESFINALLVSIPFALLITWLSPARKYIGISVGVFSYAALTFIFCFQHEHLTPCLYTLVQSINIYIYFSIGILSICLPRFIKPLSL